MENKTKQTEVQENTSPLIHEFNKDNLKESFTPKVLIMLAVVVVAGLISGFMLSSKANSNSTGNTAINSSTSAIKKGDVIGVNEASTFKDVAEGSVKVGGINGEGAFHLVRPGGESQNVYLTSSSVDLSKLINRKVKVWGQTQKAQYAGWLMDVGKIQVLE